MKRFLVSLALGASFLSGSALVSLAQAPFSKPVNYGSSSLAATHPKTATTLVLKPGTGQFFGTPTPDYPVRVVVARRTTMANGVVVPTTTRTVFLASGIQGDTLTGLTVATDEGAGNVDDTYVKDDPVFTSVTAGMILELQAAVSQLPVDTSVVHKGPVDEIVGGIKTFSNPIVGTITGSVGQSQVSGLTASLAAKAADTSVVHIGTDESITGQKTIVSTGAKPGLVVNHASMGTVGGSGGDALAMLKLWGPYSAAPHCIGVNGSNPFNGVQDPVMYIGYNVGDGGAKQVSGEAEWWIGIEPDVNDDADRSGAFVGITRNFEYNINTRPLNDATPGQRWLQFRTRRGQGGAGGAFKDFAGWTFCIAGDYGHYSIQDVAGNDLLNVVTAGDVTVKRNLTVGDTGTGTGNLTIGGTLATGGAGGFQLGVAGIGYTVTFAGNTGTLNLLRFNDAAPSIVVKPFTAGSVFSTPAIQAMAPDGTTMRSGLGQSGLQVGTGGTIRFVGNATMSGFGGAEIASLAGVGMGFASPAYLFKNAAANANYLTLDATGAAFTGPLSAGATTLSGALAGTSASFSGALSGGSIGAGTASPGQKAHVEGGSLIVNTGTGASSFRDVMVGGLGGLNNGEAHGLDWVYGTAASPTTFGRIEVKFDAARGAADMNFRSLYAGGPVTTVFLTILGDTGETVFKPGGAESARWSSGGMTVADAKNIAVGTTTGTKIGTAATQKLGLWNTTPVVQPSTTGQTAGFTVGAGTAVDSAATFTGGVGTKAYTIGDVVKHLKTIGVLAQ